MATSRNRISVICADPGQPHEFQAMLSSLRAQTGASWELLVVGDDMAGLASGDERIRRIPTQTSSVAERRNIGIENAQGELVTFCERADILGIRSLERRTQVLATRPVAAAYCGVEFTNPALDVLGYGMYGPAALSFKDMHRDPLLLGSVLGSREAMRSVRFDPDHGSAAAWAYLARLTRSGIRIARADGCEILHKVGTPNRKPEEILEDERSRLTVLQLITGVDDGAITAEPEWVHGVSDPDTPEVVTKQMAAALVRLLLANDPKALSMAIELVARLDLADGVDLRAVVRNTVARHLACSLFDVRINLDRRASRLGVCADDSGLFDRLPKIAAELARAGMPIATNRPLVTLAQSNDASLVPMPGDVLVGPFSRGEARMREGDLAYELLGSGATPGRMIDVGAHIGGSLKKFCVDGWSVWAFEPDPVNRAGLEKRAQAHWNLAVDRRAVSDSSGETVEFFRTSDSSGASSMSAFTSGHASAGTVETVTIRDALGPGWVGHVHFLKTDTEGHDLPALRGFPWEVDFPDVVLCEFEDNKTRNLGYTTEDLAAYLIDKGYDVFVSEWHPIVRYGIVHDFKSLYRFTEGSVSGDSWGNLIAVRTDAAALRLAELARAEVGLDHSTVASEPDDGSGSGVVPNQGDKPGNTSQRVKPRSRFVRAAASLVRWYATPSGALFAIASLLLALGILGVGSWRLFGVLGVAVLALFVPWKFSSQYTRLNKRLDLVSRDLAKGLDVTERLATQVNNESASTRAEIDAEDELKSLRLATAVAVARGSVDVAPPDYGAVSP